MFLVFKNCFVVCKWCILFLIFKSVLRMRRKKRRLLQCSPRFVPTKSQKSHNKSSCTGATKKRKANSMITKQNFRYLKPFLYKSNVIYNDMYDYMGYDFDLNFLYQMCSPFIIEKSHHLVMVTEGRLTEFLMGTSKNLQPVGEKLKGVAHWFVYILIFDENGLFFFA